MRAIADDWRTAARELRDLLPDLTAASDATVAAYPWGEGVEAMTRALDKLEHGDRSVEHLAGILDQVAEAADAMAAEIEYTKIMIIGSLGMLAVEIAAAWSFPPTAWATQAMATAATRWGIRILAERALSTIRSVVLRRLLGALLKFTAEHVALSTVLGAGQDLAIQLGQTAAGNREGVDWNRLGTTAFAAAAAGAAGGPAGALLGRGASRVTAPGGRWGGAVAGAVVGSAAGTIGGVASLAAGGMLHDGWAWDPRVVTAGLSYGGLVGGGRRFRSHGAGVPRLDGAFTAPDPARMGGPDGSAMAPRPENLAGPPDRTGSAPEGRRAAGSEQAGGSRDGGSASGHRPEQTAGHHIEEEGKPLDLTSEIPYTPRYAPDYPEIPEYSAPEPPAGNVWEDPNPDPHPPTRPEPVTGAELPRLPELPASVWPPLPVSPTLPMVLPGVPTVPPDGPISPVPQESSPMVSLGGCSESEPGDEYRRFALPGGSAGGSDEGGLLVRSLAGGGHFAELDPRSGEMRVVVPASPEVSADLRGVVGYFDDVPAVFYRDRFGLSLRVGGWVVNLEQPGIAVEWSRLGENAAGFRVLSGSEPIYAVRYRNTVPDNDIGMFIRDVLGSEARRTRLFPGVRR